MKRILIESVVVLIVALGVLVLLAEWQPPAPPTYRQALDTFTDSLYAADRCKTAACERAVVREQRRDARALMEAEGQDAQ